MLERHIDIYGRHPDRWPPTAAMPAAATSRPPRKRASGTWRSTRARAEAKTWSGAGVYRKLRNFRAGEAGISCLKRAYGLARCTWKGLAHFKAYVWSSVVAYNLALFARLKPDSPAHNRARYKTGRRPALDHVRILPRTPTATTTYYHVGKIPSLEIKNCTNPAPAACGQPKTPAKHPVYGRTLVSDTLPS